MISFLAVFHWDPCREVVPWNIPFLERPIYWYGFFFALGFALSYALARFLIKKYPASSLKHQTPQITLDHLVFWIGIGSLLGSRFFDIIFYQGVSGYQGDFLKMLYFWEGGLSSHGGVFGAFLAVILYFLNHKSIALSWFYLDILAVPAALLSAFIRIGNFFNQEILGKFSELPWAVTFGHPIDGNPYIPRHPVQLYESLFYLCLGAFLFLRIRSKKLIFGKGKIVGILIVSIFSFRFLIEFFKEEQSALLFQSALTMGQILSLPLIAGGLFLLLRKKALPPFVKKSGRDRR